MESVKTIAKSAITPGKLVGGLLTFIVLAAIADASGLTNWLLFPVTTAKAKFAKKAA